jgi:iron(III) transport system substrate-binding protein
MHKDHWLIAGIVALVGSMILLAVFWRPDPHVRLFCSQDEPFARGLLASFMEQARLGVMAKFDAEANKSVGLYGEIVQDRQRPRCDVFWNNEILGTIRLERQGLLAPCPSSFEKDDIPLPPSAVSSSGSWVALGTRGRVLLVNTDKLKPEDYPTSLLDLTSAKYRGQVGMSLPHHGMSATQAACLFEVLGSERAKQFYRDLKANGVQLSPGNKQAAEWAGSGYVAIGLTDTDDALAEVRAGKPVKLIFPDGVGEPRFPRMGTLFVPNTLCIVKNGPNPENARLLVEYLTTAEVEKALARGDSAQIPVRKALRAELPWHPEQPPRRRPGRLRLLHAQPVAHLERRIHLLRELVVLPHLLLGAQAALEIGAPVDEQSPRRDQRGQLRQIAGQQQARCEQAHPHARRVRLPGK